MKVLLPIITILFSGFVTVNTPGIEAIRNCYSSAVTNKSICSLMIKQLENDTENNISLAYLGVFQTIWANHVHNPFTKLHTFNKGKANINKAVTLEPSNVEIIYIRHSVQKNSPAFLGYKENLKDDRISLLQKVNSITSPTLKKMVINLLNS